MSNCESKADLQENLEMDLGFAAVEQISASEFQSLNAPQRRQRFSRERRQKQTTTEVAEVAEAAKVIKLRSTPRLVSTGQKKRTIGEAEKSQSCAPALRRAAMDYLARREHSFYELKQKLYTRFPDVDPDAIQLDLEKLRLEKLQSDERFVEAFVRYRRGKGFGYSHIKQDLQSRRVAESLVSKYLSDDDSEWIEILHSVITRKLIQGNDLKTLQRASSDHSKIIRFLQNRGFRLFEINRVLPEFLR